MSEHTDRRVRRTRDALHRALIELMIERGYERVTVSDIIERADVGRSTFYAHYRDKDDLLLVSCTEFLRREIAHTADTFSPLGSLRVLFQLAGRYPEVYRPLVGPKAATGVIHAYRRGVAQLIAELFDEWPTTTVAFVSWGLIGLIAEIIDPADPLPAGQAWQQFERLAAHGIRGGADPATADGAAGRAPGSHR
ncbi:TetR/AcrR family transcriptional regulator [Nocardia caishijiensis]|uniref:TetR family transcriptional regulator n=1 Tax=Nocardia caishijiensis TaxID=184756 RepID=A0ABQ6YJF0_9NOCA|nr:TetR/AcrR family transcriptional regulator [Nocardia caishijiensis]KAF0845629.1 TetR family transcriptional regulator [Nocardia caishijiensis]